MVPLQWRIVIFWGRVVSALLALISVVVAIILTSGFPNVLLALVAASMWSLISSFFIYIVTNNRASLDHWIVQLSFEVSNIFTNFGAFVVVLLLVYLPTFGGTKLPTSAGNSLTLMSLAFTLISGLLWTSSSVYLTVHVRRENALIADRERISQNMQTLSWLPPPKSMTPDTLSSNNRRRESRRLEATIASRRSSRLGTKVHRSMFIEDFESSNGKV